jgi:hypothetical protein
VARSTEPVQKSHGQIIKAGGGELCRVPCRQAPAVNAHVAYSISRGSASSKADKPREWVMMRAYGDPADGRYWGLSAERTNRVAKTRDTANAAKRCHGHAGTLVYANVCRREVPSETPLEEAKQK